MQQVISYLNIIRSYIAPYRRVTAFGFVGVLAVIVFALGTVALVARNTMPDDRLYTFKVNVYEPAVMVTKWSNESKAAYGTSLLDTRFTELMTLRNEGSATIERASALNARSAEMALATYQFMKESSLTNEERLDGLFQISIRVKAMETLTQADDALAHSEEAYEELRKTVSAQLSENIEAYASSTEQLRTEQYLGSHVARVTELLPTVANGSDAQRQALARVEAMKVALEENDLAGALMSVLRAEEGLIVDGMVWGSERGEAPSTTLVASTTEGQ